VNSLPKVVMQLLPRLYSAQVRSSRKLRYIRIRTLPLLLMFNGRLISTVSITTGNISEFQYRYRYWQYFWQLVLLSNISNSFSYYY